MLVAGGEGVGWGGGGGGQEGTLLPFLNLSHQGIVMSRQSLEAGAQTS